MRYNRADEVRIQRDYTHNLCDREIAVDNAMRIMAETAARLLLQEYRDTHADWADDRTPVDALVSWLGLHIETFHPADYAAGTYGFTDPDEEEDLIWLRRDMLDTLRRFTLAHELGHAMLHCHGGSRFQALLERNTTTNILSPTQHNIAAPSPTDPCHETDIQEDMSRFFDQDQHQETLGIGQTYDPRSQRELAANLFAAALLIPLERLRTLYLEQQVPAHTLASTFGVSHAALLNRLVSLLKVPETIQEPGAASQQKQTDKPPAIQPQTRYDEFQQAAIAAPTPALISAGPGSGKTSTLIGRVNYLIRTLGVQSQQILALTFSRKAAQEMEERLQQVLDNTKPKVSTFHAFCADLLRQHGTLVGLRTDFALIDEAEGYFLLRQLANDLHLHHYQKLQAPTYYFPALLKAISRAKDELVSPAAYAAMAQQMKEQAKDANELEQAEKALEVAHIYALYEQALLRRGDTDFSGLLVLTLQLFSTQPELLYQQQQKYQQILVDEFQDVNRASGVLLRELAGHEQHVWVVGDANQAIYGFRGASPANISQFEQDFPGAAVLPLSRNYRSRPDLVHLAESFRCVQLELGQEPGKNQPARLTREDTSVTLAKATSEANEFTGIVQDMRYKHAHGYSYKDMVVLCRTRAQAQKISRKLSAEGLPIVEQGGMLEQEHIKDILSIVLLLTDTSGKGLLRAAQQREHTLSQSDIEALLLAAREPDSNPRLLLLTDAAPLNISVEGRHALTRLSQILQTLQHYNDVWSLLAQYLLIETSLVRDLLTATNSKQQSTQLADYDRLLQLARHYDQQQAAQLAREGSESAQAIPPPLEERAGGFLEYLNLLVLLRQDGGSRQGEEESTGEDPEIIRVMTVHASKGLEFPVVYMPGLVQRRFPLQARANPVATPTGMLRAESEGSTAHESGEACLFYVGVTRAREQLVLSYSERYGKLKYKRSPYLDALEAGLASERMSKLQWDFTPATGDPELAEQVLSPTRASCQPGENFINAMRSPTLSASAIEAYQRCPRQYAYSAIYHFAGETATYQLFWQATHKTVEEFREQLHTATKTHDAEKIVPGQEELKALYNKHWQALGGPEAPFAALYEEHGHEVIEALRRKISTQNEVIWDVRSPFNVEVAGKTVHVTIDRVEVVTQIDRPTRFIRTRFGKRQEKPAAETRELFYTLAYRQQHPGRSVELHSHNMSTGEVIPITMTARKEQSLYEGVEQAIEGLERNTYPAQPAEPFRCPGCPFFLICPA